MAKTTKAIDLRKLSAEQIVEQIEEAREQLMRMRFQKATGELKDQNAPRGQRRKIAQLLTILREKGGAPAAPKKAAAKNAATKSAAEKTEGEA
jgi:large subunit ribosomal protein L29